MDLSGLTSQYTEYLNQQVNQAQNKKIKEAVSKDYSGASEDELMEVCQEFEAYFVEQIFKQMEKTIPKAEEGDSSTSTLVDYFKDATLQELTKQSTKTQGLGIAQMLYEQMKRNYDIK